MPKPLSEQVVVITGASSGIGRCTAEHLAARGARVVLTARREEVLAEIVRGIEARGGQALAVPGDVTREDDLRAVAREAVARFGRIDTWVNNAGVMVHGGVLDVPLDDVRHVLDVSFVGVVNGTRCALEVMLPQGSGVIVQMASIAARRGAPYMSAYSAAKAALVTFTESLRAELWGRGVAFSILYPSTVDTPVFEQSRGHLGVIAKPLPPMADPEEVARAVARLAESGARTGYVFWARPAALLSAAFPALTDWFLHRMREAMQSDEPPAGASPSAVRGGWADEGWRGLTLRETVRVLPWETMLAAASAGALAALAGSQRRR